MSSTVEDSNDEVIHFEGIKIEGLISEGTFSASLEKRHWLLMIILEFESYTENPFAAERFDLTKIFCWRQSLGLVDFLFDFRRSRNPKSRLNNKLMWTFKPSENTFVSKKITNLVPQNPWIDLLPGVGLVEAEWPREL